MPKASEPLYHDIYKVPVKCRAFFRELTSAAGTIFVWEFFWWVVRHFTITFH